MNEKIINISQYLVCVLCKSKMQTKNGEFTCISCGKTYILNNTKLVVAEASIEKIVDPLDKIKLLLKPFSKLYTCLIKVVSPVYVDGTLKKFIKKNVIDNNLYLNLGSGNIRIHPIIVNVDFMNYPNVDVVADITRVPLEDESCDGIFIIGVLEHISNPCTVIDEMYRLLKRGGFVYAFFPFIQGYHASPHDYFRTTQEGTKVLFQSFKTIEIKPAGGPTSGLLWILQDWLSMVLSLGIKPLYYFWYILIMIITFPLKFLDIILIYHPMAAHITSGFTIIAKK